MSTTRVNSSGVSRVGVGWEGSPEAAQALRAARAIAASTGATIEPLLVLPRQSLKYGEPIQHRWSEVAMQLTPEDRARLDGLDELDGQVSTDHLANSSPASATTSIC